MVGAQSQLKQPGELPYQGQAAKAGPVLYSNLMVRREAGKQATAITDTQQSGPRVSHSAPCKRHHAEMAVKRRQNTQCQSTTGFGLRRLDSIISNSN